MKIPSIVVYITGKKIIFVFENIFPEKSQKILEWTSLGVFFKRIWVLGGGGGAWEPLQVSPTKVKEAEEWIDI